MSGILGLSHPCILDHYSLYRTDDGGETWTPLGKTDIGVLPVFLDELTGYAIGSDLLVTRDGGATFSPTDPADGECPRYRFVNKDVCWKEQNYQLFATTDRGRTWSHVPLGYRVLRAHPLSRERVWVTATDCGTGECGPALLFSTEDGGKTWTQHDLGNVLPMEVQFLDADYGWLWAGTEGENLYRTEDGGQTWRQLR